MGKVKSIFVFLLGGWGDGGGSMSQYFGEEGGGEAYVCVWWDSPPHPLKKKGVIMG